MAIASLSCLIGPSSFCCGDCSSVTTPTWIIARRIIMEEGMTPWSIFSLLQLLCLGLMLSSEIVTFL